MNAGQLWVVIYSKAMDKQRKSYWHIKNGLCGEMSCTMCAGCRVIPGRSPRIFLRSWVVDAGSFPVVALQNEPQSSTAVTPGKLDDRTGP
jgi:hypothetical protein